MKQENICFIYSMINNLIIAVIKIIGGFVFKLNTLFADGLHTFSDFITDIIAFAGMKISKKKATKIHPFGFGRVEYITNLFVGIIIFLLGIFILYNSFQGGHSNVSLYVIAVAIISIVLKISAILYMYTIGKKYKSATLLMGVSESMTDVYSSIGVIIITLLMQLKDKIQILQYSDMIGSILISMIIFKTSYTILKNNVFSLLGEREMDKPLNEEVEKYILEYKDVKDCKIELIKYGEYYLLNLELELDSKMTLLRATKLQDRIIKNIKRKKDFKIKYVDIHIESNN